MKWLRWNIMSALALLCLVDLYYNCELDFADVDPNFIKITRFILLLVGVHLQMLLLSSTYPVSFV